MIRVHRFDVWWTNRNGHYDRLAPKSLTLEEQLNMLEDQQQQQVVSVLVFPIRDYASVSGVEHNVFKEAMYEVVTRV